MQIADLGKAAKEPRAWNYFPPTLPPECIVNGQFVPENYTQRSDVYQLGIALCQVLCRIDQEEMYGGSEYGNIGFLEQPAITQSESYSKLERESPRTADFLKRMLDPDPDKRPNAREVAEFFDGRSL